MRSPDASPSRARRAAQRGFTLIEVIVAFAILALVLGTLSGAFSAMFGGAAEARNYQVAVALAESKLAEIGAIAALKPGETRGRFGDGYAWRARVRPFVEPGREREERPLDLFSVDVVVSWGARGGRQVTLETLRLASRATLP